MVFFFSTSFGRGGCICVVWYFISVDCGGFFLDIENIRVERGESKSIVYKYYVSI